jgi:ATPase subunit of ABC transporter with duplicated ATPase domains
MFSDKKKKWKFLNQLMKFSQSKNQFDSKTHFNSQNSVILKELQPENQPNVVSFENNKKLTPSTGTVSDNYLTEIGIINKIKQINEHKHKNLKNFEWDNIPMFSLITGENGVGKTSLLDIFVMGYDDNENIEKNNVSQENIELLRLDFEKSLYPHSNSRSDQKFDNWNSEYILKLTNYCKDRYQNPEFKIESEFEKKFQEIKPIIGVEYTIKELIEKLFKQSSLSKYINIPNLIHEYLKQNDVFISFLNTGFRKWSIEKFKFISF